jgi:hypothetical protein
MRRALLAFLLLLPLHVVRTEPYGRPCRRERCMLSLGGHRF